ncbi:MAG: NUDIX hydrolase [Gammaproteobacteria bacterium]|nr:MAG: NUDIX hydrolase [Gammaproteobacteria bacterium]
MTWKPNATVAVIVEQDNKFLLVEEFSHEKLVINQPAGHIEANETILEAVIRETLEETGYRVAPQHLTGFYTYTSPNNGITYYRFCFSATIVEKLENPRIDPDIENIVWLTRDELQQAESRHRSPLVMRCIDDYLAGKRYPLDLIYEHPASE